MYINGIEKTWYRFAFKYIYTALTAEQAIWSAMRGNQDIARNLNAIFMNPKHRLHELYKKTLLQMDADGKIRIFSDCMPGIIDTDDVNNSVFTNIFTEGFSLGEILYDTIYSLLLYTAQQGPNSQYPIFEKIAIHLRDTDLIWELIVNDPRFEEIKNIGVSVVSSRPLTTNKAAEKPEWFKSYLGGYNKSIKYHNFLIKNLKNLNKIILEFKSLIASDIKERERRSEKTRFYNFSEKEIEREIERSVAEADAYLNTINRRFGKKRRPVPIVEEEREEKIEKLMKGDLATELIAILKECGIGIGDVPFDIFAKEKGYWNNEEEKSREVVIQDKYKVIDKAGD